MFLEVFVLNMECYNGLGMLEEDRFKLTVIEGSQFDGASRLLVREHFRKWRERAIHEEHKEQRTRGEIKAQRSVPDPVPDTKPREDLPTDSRRPWVRSGYGYVRYKFCVQIEEEVLQSIVSSEGEEFVYGKAWVNLIEGGWSAEAAAAEREEAKAYHVDMFGDLVGFDDEVFPEIDGCIEENVGWMKVQYQALIPEFYIYLQYPSASHDQSYVRPPGIAYG